MLMRVSATTSGVPHFSRSLREVGIREVCSEGFRSLAYAANSATQTKFAVKYSHAPVAQLDRASAFGAEGWEFESLRAHHLFVKPLPNRIH